MKSHQQLYYIELIDEFSSPRPFGGILLKFCCAAGLPCPPFMRTVVEVAHVCGCIFGDVSISLSRVPIYHHHVSIVTRIEACDTVAQLWISRIGSPR